MIARSLVLGVAGFVLAGSAVLAREAVPARPAPPPPRPVTEDYFGTKITDDYRYMESPGDPDFAKWIRAEGAYTRARFDTPKRNAARERITAFTGSFSLANSYDRQGSREFWLERAPGSDNYDLMVRDGQGQRKLIDVAALRAANGGKPMAINYFGAAPDGSKVAVGISEGGSELAGIAVYDASSGVKQTRTVERAQFGSPAWSADAKTLYFNLLAPARPGAPATERYLNSSGVAWDLAKEPVALVGGGAGASVIKVRPDQFAAIGTLPGIAEPMALVINGVQNELELWLAPDGSEPALNTSWRRAFTFDDGITNFARRGDALYLLSHQGAPTFQLLRLKVGLPVSAATVVMSASATRVIESVAAARDGVYVAAREGLASKLYRIDDSGAASEIAVPPGSIAELRGDVREDGVHFIHNGWATPSRVLAYTPGQAAPGAVPLGVIPADFQPADFAVSEVAASARDGTRVPLSVIRPATAKGPGPMLINAYGSYGISNYPYFSARQLGLVREGFTAATCHVRGGGEFGEAWRLGGKDADKPNTWRDLIACAEAAIAAGLTTPRQLFVSGGSAGGIPMGMAPLERPELFAGVIDQVPMASALRAEFQTNGPANIVEFGTIKNPQGFRNLLAMDGYANLKKGKALPAYLITTGLNDPRVDSWQPGKLAAKMRAYNPANTVLLRVDEEGGHGIGSTKAQADALSADMLSFMRWQLGEDGWVRGE